MAILDDLKDAVHKIAVGTWEITDGRVVPDTVDIGLGNKGVRLNAAMFYADLADSIELVSYNQSTAAEVFKAFLFCGTKLILHNGGRDVTLTTRVRYSFLCHREF